ncbi:MAG: class I SAM-dependent methyltransferase [Candidatus Parvarchaeota archaeon]
MENELSYKIMYFMHDNFILKAVKDPYTILKSIGIGTDMTVIDVGCGPGYYTIPAAKLVGNSGKVYALDIYKKVPAIIKNKMAIENLKNIDIIIKNAEDTGIENNSVDFEIMFGFIHSLSGIDGIIREMRRILKVNGIMAVQKTPGVKKKELIEKIESFNFHFEKNINRIFLFKKN